MDFKLEKFEGTLDDLIAGIKSGKLNIYEIPLVEITHQFVSKMEELKQKLPTSDLSEFYRSASELIYIKTAMLLPNKVEWEDEEEDLKVRVIDALEKLRFSRYLDLLLEFKEQQSMDFRRFESPFRIPFADEDIFKSVETTLLAETYQYLMEKYIASGKKDENGGSKEIIFNVFERVTVNEKLQYLIELFETKDKVLFTELIKYLDDKGHITCAFMAVLEAVRLKICGVRQAEVFGDIWLIKKEKDFDESKAGEYDEEADEAIDDKIDMEDKDLPIDEDEEDDV